MTMNIIDQEFKPYTIKLTEKFNKQALYSHIYGGYCDMLYSGSLLRYLERSKNDAVEIVYNVRQIGRLSPTFKDGTKAFCQMLFWCNTKKAVCTDYYNDVDIVNCQPVLLEQLMEYHGLNTKYIKIYNNTREDILKRIMEHDNIDRQGAKKKVYKIMFSSDDQILKLMKDNNRFSYVKSLYNYILQILQNRRELLKLYPQFMEFYKMERKRKQKEGKSKQFNPEGGPFAYMAQHLERICLLSMYEYFTSKGLTVGALIHDGLHLEINPKNTRVLKWCEKHILKQTGFKVEIKIKPFELRDEYTNKIHFDTLKEINRLDIKTHRLSTRYLTKRGADDAQGYQLANHIKMGKINLVKSFPGSGKTKMIKLIQKKYPKYSILSIVSRRTLSDMHERDFGLVNYQHSSKHGLNEVFQLDSIDKIPKKPKGKFILVLDEGASLCSHFLNHMKKMSSNRLLFIKRFADLINDKNCKMVIGLDANLNYGTIKFLSDISTKQIVLFNNDYQIESDIPLTVCTNKFTLLRSLIDLLNSGGRAFVCSNVNDDFKREIVDVIKRECNLRDGEYLLYSSNEGENYINTDEWASKRCIFATPSIIYGCDSNNGFHVFAFYYNGAHFDAMDMNQQINRERSPASINVYMTNYHCKPYSSLDKTISECTSKFSIVDDLKNIPTEVIEPTKQLLFYEEYRRSHHLNTRHHLLDLLRQKGYTNISFNVSETTPIKYLSREEHLNALINKYYNGELNPKLYDDLLDKFAVFGIDLSTTDDKQLLFFERILEKHLDKFISRNRYTQLINYRIYKCGKYNKLKAIAKRSKLTLSKFQLNSDNYDIVENIIKNTSTKLYLLNKLRIKLGFRRFQKNINKTLTKKNYKEVIPIESELVDLINECFRVRSSTKKIKPKMVRSKLTQFYCYQMNSILGNVMMANRQKIKGVDYRYPIFDMEAVRDMDDLITLSERLPKCSEYDNFLFDN